MDSVVEDAASIADGTGTDARFSAPRILGFGKLGDLYVEDSGPVIRRITPAAMVSTVASAPPEVGQQATAT